ncbi:MAG TPA: tRNA 2-selenouridine(34) synthase MnmH [Parachlamydiaceae bacterium]|nr:tRNA 2-selenouridine(34) synthase MnmH [Parachlamydiaceae bacterium]
MTQIEAINAFLIPSTPLLDVRSPSEFLQGHIPGAVSFPLFTDEERTQVGTIYKKQGKDAAVKLGLHFVGPKLSFFIKQAEGLASRQKTLRLYCARGGMRSSSLAWLLETAGFSTMLLKGGYKEFRNWTLNQFKLDYIFNVLGGLTGSGKTEKLHELEQKKEQIIDLEKLACHKGSSFGHLGNPGQQPSTEHFENLLAHDLSKLNIKAPIWIEDESRMIGHCHIPLDLWNKMGQSRFVWVECSKEERIDRLLKIYGNYPKHGMIEATQRLCKKLGTVRTKQAIQCILDNDLKGAILMLLDYYDQAYTYFCKRRTQNGVIA